LVGGLVGWLGGLYDLTPWGQNNHFSQTLGLAAHSKSNPDALNFLSVIC
jgi:hypothetical protein